MSARAPRTQPGRVRFTALVALIALALTAATCGYYRVEVGRVRGVTFDEISAIAGLKAGQILQWRDERLADVRSHAGSPLFRQALADWRLTGFSEKGRVQWRELLDPERASGLADALLLELDGHVLLSAQNDDSPVHQATSRVVAAAVASREAVLSDIYRASNGRVYTDAAAPVFDAGGTPIAVLVQRSDAESFLFPLVQSWPTRSPSAETYLVHRERNEVVVLTDLRGRSGSALRFRYTLDQTDRPSVQAALGRRGAFEGRDYRGMAVLADLRPIPGSPWFQVAKVDVSEIQAEARYRAGTIGLIGLLCVLLAGAAVASGYRQTQARIFRDLYESERLQRETYQEFRTALYSIGDAVITTDREGRVRQMNPVAEQLTGWAEVEARGRSLDDVFRIVSEDTRAPIESPMRRVVEEGAVVGLANHALLIARDGTERPIADSGAPIREPDGAVTGTVLVFSDQTRQRAAQLALEESEERLRLALQAANQGFYDLNVQTGETVVSPEYARMLGYRPEEFVESNTRWRERLHPDDREPVYRVYEEYIAGRRDDYRVEFRQRTKDGGWKWVLSLGRLVERDAQGRPLRMLGTHTDITDRKQAEAELRLSEGRYRALAEHIPAVIYTAKVDDVGSTLFVNPRIEKLLGFSPEEWSADTDLWWRQVHPDDRDRVASDLARSQAQHGRFVCEYRLLRRDGGVVWVRDEADRLQFAADQAPIILGVMLDITDRKQAEDTLQASEERYRLVSRLSSDFAYSCVDDQSGAFVVDWITEAFFTLTGFAKEELRTQRCWLFVAHPDDRAAAIEPLGRLRPGEEDSREFRIVTSDGHVRWFANHVECTADATAPGGRRVFGAVRDVTERKRAEEQRERMEAQLRQSQKMEAVGRLAGGVAHDFNNMLQTIRGYAEMALEQLAPDSPIRADIEEINKAAQRSADLTRQLLAFARKQTIAPQVLDLNTTISSMLKMLGRLIGEDIDLRFTPAPGLPMVKMDPGQVDQILANLVVNSRDAIAGVGKILIDTAPVELDAQYCRTHAGFLPGHYVMLAVSDDGCGIDKAAMGRLFEPFFTTKPLGQGTGLGLSTVYGIVKQNDGFINVDSEPGSGTVIRIYLPQLASALAAALETAPRARPQRGVETVLLVEDENALLELGARLLRQLGYTVLATRSPAAAIELVKARGHDVDLLMTDVVMPEMSGRELWEQLSALQPSLKCLFTSGYTADVITHRGVLHEGVHFLQKPYSREALALKLREVLSAA